MSKDLSTMTKLELQQFLDSFDNVFCDIDGVILGHNCSLLDGAAKSLRKLSEMGKKICFVTHNHFYERGDIHRKLSEIIPNLTIDDIITPCSAMIAYLKEIKFDKVIWYLGTKICKRELLNAGFKVAQTKVTTLDESSNAILNEGVDNPNIGAVICDYDINLNYTKILKATVYLKRKEVLFLGGPTESVFSIGDRMGLGPASFITLLEQLSGRSHISFGKPSDKLGEYLINEYGIQNKSRCLFVGDSLPQDITFGNKLGFQTLLVLGFIINHHDSYDNSLSPTYIIRTFGDLNSIIEEKFK